MVARQPFVDCHHWQKLFSGEKLLTFFHFSLLFFCAQHFVRRFMRINDLFLLSCWIRDASDKTEKMASGGPYKNTLSNGGKKRCDRLMALLIDDGQFLRSLGTFQFMIWQPKVTEWSRVWNAFWLKAVNSTMTRHFTEKNCQLSTQRPFEVCTSSSSQGLQSLLGNFVLRLGNSQWVFSYFLKPHLKYAKIFLCQNAESIPWKSNGENLIARKIQSLGK